MYGVNLAVKCGIPIWSNAVSWKVVDGAADLSPLCVCVVRLRQEEKRQQEESSKVKDRKRKREKYAERVSLWHSLLQQTAHKGLMAAIVLGLNIAPLSCVKPCAVISYLGPCSLFSFFCCGCFLIVNVVCPSEEKGRWGGCQKEERRSEPRYSLRSLSR